MFYLLTYSSIGELLTYYTEFGSSRSNDTGDPPKFCSAGAPPTYVGERGYSPKSTPLPTWVIVLNLVVLRQTVWATGVIRGQKIGSPGTPLLGLGAWPTLYKHAPALDMLPCRIWSR